MLQKIRDRITGWVAGIFLGAIAVVFIFWGIDFQNSATAAGARVNGEAVPLDEVRRAWQERQAELQAETRDELPTEIVQGEQREILDQFIRRELLRQRADELGYRVGDQKLVETLSSIPALQVDGQFSRDRYAALLRQQGRSEAAFEDELRKDLQIGELQRGIALSAFVTPGELARRIELEGEQRDFDFAVLPAARFESTAAVADEEVARWYEANKTRYVTTETVALQYVELTLDSVARDVEVDEAVVRAHYEEVAAAQFAEPEQRRGSHILIESGDDDAAARQRAEVLFKEAQAGGDFAALARANSADPGSKEQGGDLGWSTREAYVAPFAEALFSMQKGEIRGPVRTEFGYHVLRLDDIRPGTQRSYESVREELADEMRREQAQSIFYERSQQLADESFAALSELETVAQRLGLELHAVKSFTRSGGGPFGAERKLIDTAFSSEVLGDRQNSAPVSIGDDRVVVLRVTAHEESRQQSIAEVRAGIETELRAETARTAAAAAANAALAQLTAGAAWSEVVAALESTAGGQVTVTRRTGEYPPELLAAVFAAAAPEAGKPTPGVATLASGDPVVFIVSARRPGAPPADDPAGQLAGERRAVSAMSGALEFAAYLAEIERNAKIKRNDKAFE